MKLISAYVLVVIIWSTTPVAIQFSQTDMHFFSAVSLRMWLSAVLSLPLLWVFRQRLVMTREALMSYVAGSVAIYAAMMTVYWGALFIPSGLISVMYGLSPMLTGLLGVWWLKERELSSLRVVALGLAFAGLVLVVSGRLTSAEGLALGEFAVRGVIGTLLSVLCFALSAVWVKKINAPVHPVVQTSGTLWVSSFFFVLTVPVLGWEIPAIWDAVALSALGYLVVCGSLLAFVLYFYILQHLPTARVALITLIAPVLALIWGYLLRDERLQMTTLGGVLLLLLGLLIYQWHTRLVQWHGRIARWFLARVTKSKQKRVRSSS